MQSNFYHRKISLRLEKFILLTCTTVIVIVACSKSDARAPRKTNEVWVNDIGASGQDTLNDTWAFQKAIDSMASHGGGIVKAKPGKYYIDVDSSINMKSDVTLELFDTTRQLIAIPTFSGRYKIISFVNVRNASVHGGKITGERDRHLGPVCPHKCEQGYGISISESSNIKIAGSSIKECWGDGIMISGIPGATNKNIALLEVTSACNRRQGLSILNVNGLIVDSCAFLNTQGTPPQDGIDIEPDAGTVENVTITHCLFSYNAGNGIELNAKPSTSAVIRNIKVWNNVIQFSKYAGYLQHASNVEFKGNTFQAIKYFPHVKAFDCTECMLSSNTDK